MRFSQAIEDLEMSMVIEIQWIRFREHFWIATGVIASKRIASIMQIGKSAKFVKFGVYAVSAQGKFKMCE